MSNVVNVHKTVKSLETSPQLDGYTKVVLEVSDDILYTAGTDEGLTLTVSSPWGNQQIAEDILSRIRGFQYQPYSATGAQVDVAAELGDGINVGNVYSGLFSQTLRFGRLCFSDIAAPTEKTLDHEYPYASSGDRKIVRKLKSLTSELRVQADLISATVADMKSETAELRSALTVQSDRITAEVLNRQNEIDKVSSALDLQADRLSAKVDRQSSAGSTSFGWTLTDSKWELFSGSSTVLRADATGLEVSGTVRATEGAIGGFSIKQNALSYNNHVWGGTNSQGIYIGPQGIQLGKNFKVDNAGNLIASSGTFTGAVNAGNIKYGGSSGTLSGSAITPQSISGGSGGGLSMRTITTSNLTGGINTSLGYADFSNGVFNGWNTASDLKCRALEVKSSKFKIEGSNVLKKSIRVLDASGEPVTLTYFGW